MSIYKVFLYSLLIYPLIGNNSVSSFLSFENNIRNELIITVEPQIHIDFGLSYPITYELDIPHSSQNLNAYRKYNSSQNWNLINRKTSDDFFNGVEAVRFDYDEQKAYVSLGFSSLSDSIFIKLEDSDGNFVSSSIVGISEYYDREISKYYTREISNPRKPCELEPEPSCTQSGTKSSRDGSP